MGAAISAAAKEVVSGTKGTIWKYFGAMMMEDKGGKQAVSYTRTLGLILFGSCMLIWNGVGGTAGVVPQSMLWTLWGLIGIKGGKDIAAALKK